MKAQAEFCSLSITAEKNLLIVQVRLILMLMLLLILAEQKLIIVLLLTLVHGFLLLSLNLKCRVDFENL